MPHLPVSVKPPRIDGNGKKVKSAAKVASDLDSDPSSGLPDTIRNWNWKFGNPAIISVENLKKQPKFTGPKLPLPVDAKAANGLESDPLPGLPATIRPQMDPLENESPDYISWLCDPKQSLIRDPAMVLVVDDLEKQLQSTGPMPALPVSAKAATSDLEFDPPLGLPPTIQPQMDPLQNQSSDYISWLCDPKQSLIRDPAIVSVEDLEKQLQSTGPMPALPVSAKTTSDLKSDPPPGLPSTICPEMDPLQNQSSDYISWLCEPKQSLIVDPATVSGNRRNQAAKKPSKPEILLAGLGITYESENPSKD